MDARLDHWRAVPVPGGHPIRTQCAPQMLCLDYQGEWALARNFLTRRPGEREDGSMTVKTPDLLHN